MAGLRLLLQARGRAPERRAALADARALRPIARPDRPERLGVVLQPLLGRPGDLALRLRLDAEQPHDRGDERLLRALSVPADLGRRRAVGLGVPLRRLL